MTVNILYFARLAETLGSKQEILELPDHCQTISDLVTLLRARGEPFDSAFDGDTRVLVAINQEMGESGQSIQDGDEVAFFPPVTGG
ncbi:MAG: molybdopterin converting factor subunit 1 [Pseudomonadota bacterium]